MRMIMDLRSGLWALYQAVDDELILRILVKKKVLCAVIALPASRPII